MRSNYIFTSESVSEGHPDKVADQISDAIVDLFLSKDPEARIACETLTTTQLVVLAGEIRGKGIMDEAGNWAPGVRDEVEKAVRDTVKCRRLIKSLRETMTVSVFDLKPNNRWASSMSSCGISRVVRVQISLI